MTGLVDLLPDTLGAEKEAMARQLELTKGKNYKPVAILKKTSQMRFIKKGKRKTIKQDNKQQPKRKSIDEKRMLAREGIILFDHGFVNSNKSFYQGRRRSLEWNDEIARSRYKKGKKKKKKTKNRV